MSSKKKRNKNHCINKITSNNNNDTGQTHDGNDDYHLLEQVVENQLEALDSSDSQATIWAEALSKYHLSNEKQLLWGGRGKGGRGLARRTFQPHDVVVENVSMEYTKSSRDGEMLFHKTLLEDTKLKLLCSHVYGLCGSNGAGKSSILKRINSCKFAGFPPHLTTMYIQQELFFLIDDLPNENDLPAEKEKFQTPMDIVQIYYQKQSMSCRASTQSQIEEIEHELESLDLSEEEETVERLCERISLLEEEKEASLKEDELEEIAKKAFQFFDVPHNVIDNMKHIHMTQLSAGIRKKIALACALICRPDILLLDNPESHLDVIGLLKLRSMISILSGFEREDHTSSSLVKQHEAIIVMVCSDIDLINDVVTDIIHFNPYTKKLDYYPGNYNNFEKIKHQYELHEIRSISILEKQRNSMLKTIDNLKQTSNKSKSNKNKVKKQISSRKKKLEKLGLQKDEHGHRWTSQKAGTGIKACSINSIDASTRNKMDYKKLIKISKESVTSNTPDKAIQFIFQPTKCTWGEPLIMLMDVGHYFLEDKMLFDCVDLCINEGSRTIILGKNSSGKSTLLQILAGKLAPKEGKVHFAQRIKESIGFFDQHIADNMIKLSMKQTHSHANLLTPLSLLTQQFPLKTEQELRGELTSFGISPKQATTSINFLSGGERWRLCLTMTMLRRPDVLILDEPTSQIDAESITALIHGLQNWNGTIIIVSHDSNFVRQIGGEFYVIHESKLKSVPGIDSYILFESK